MLTGVSVDTIKSLWKEMAVDEQQIKVVPWARGYNNTLNNDNSVLFTMAKTQERESLFKWVGPIYFAEHLLIGQADFAHKVETIEDAHQFSVAAIHNDISEITLREQDFSDEKIVLITHLRQAILMLKHGRVDLIIVSRSSLNALLNDQNLSMSDVKIVYSVNKVGNYFAFNKNTPDVLIEKFQQAFDRISDQREQINKKYQVNFE